MKKILMVAYVSIIYISASAQELFVFTEPASNMAAKSIGIRINNAWMKDHYTNISAYYLTPELMVGISKKIMVHVLGFMSYREGKFTVNGGSIYTKYRFHSQDDVHRHFRIAAFARYSFNNMPVHQPAIDVMARNSGYETGLVATQLINKIAISASVAAVHATDNGKEKFLYEDKNRNALNYTFSAGKLLLPKEYNNYEQTNVNLMIEALGQLNLATGNSFLDIAPSLQFIINSRLRVDAGYRFAVKNNLYRSSPQNAVLKLEYNFYNIWK